MFIAIFLMEDKDKKFQFFEKIFLLANFSMNIILEIVFYILSNIIVNFLDWNLN